MGQKSQARKGAWSRWLVTSSHQNSCLRRKYIRIRRNYVSIHWENVLKILKINIIAFQRVSNQSSILFHCFNYIGKIRALIWKGKALFSVRKRFSYFRLVSGDFESRALLPSVLVTGWLQFDQERESTLSVGGIWMNLGGALWVL